MMETARQRRTVELQKMIESETRAALALTLSDITDFFDAVPTRMARDEAALLQATCIPLLEILGRPYVVPRTLSRGGEEFSLRLDPPHTADVTTLHSTVTHTLTDAADYLVHISDGGARNTAVENYITIQSLNLLDQLGAARESQNPLR